MNDPLPQNIPSLWTSRETAKVLKISERLLWTLTNRGKIRCVRIGRAVRYDPADIRSWIDSQKTLNSSAETGPETT
jgi:excisionase family DNA binding protein